MSEGRREREAWWARWDLNPGSPDYESGALTNLATGPPKTKHCTELHRQKAPDPRVLTVFYACGAQKNGPTTFDRPETLSKNEDGIQPCVFAENALLSEKVSPFLPFDPAWKTRGVFQNLKHYFARRDKVKDFPSRKPQSESTTKRFAVTFSTQKKFLRTES